MDDEVGEGFVVRGGVMMRTADVKKEQLEPMKLYYIDVDRSQTYQHAEACNVTFLDDEASSSRVTVEVSSLSGDRRLFHICDNLPGLNQIFFRFLIRCVFYFAERDSFLIDNIHLKLCIIGKHVAGVCYFIVTFEILVTIKTIFL